MIYKNSIFGEILLMKLWSICCDFFMGVLKVFLSFFMVFFPFGVWAAVGCDTSNLAASFADSSDISQPADYFKIGQQIGGKGTAVNPQVFKRPVNNINACHLVYSEVIPYGREIVAGVVFNGPDGKTYPVFTTKKAGIGVALGIADTKSKDYLPLNEPYTVTYNSTEKDNVSMGFNAVVYFVVIGQLQVGPINMNNEKLAEFRVRSREGEYQRGVFITASINLDVIPSSCIVNSSDYVMKLPRVNVSDFNGVPVGAAPLNVSHSQPQTIGLTCDKGVTVYATLTDSLDPNSTGDYLIPDNEYGELTAEGVGVQIFKDGGNNPLKLGPESPNPENLNSWFVHGKTGADKTPVNFNLEAGYVRTDQRLKAGKVKSVGHITFSYR